MLLLLSFLGQTFINIELCLSIKIKLVINDIAEFFLIKQGLFTMFPINKTNKSFWIWSSCQFSQISGRPLFLQIVYSLQCHVRLKKLYFPIGYLVCFLEYLIKINCFFYHTVPMNLGFATFCSQSFIFILVTI